MFNKIPIQSDPFRFNPIFRLEQAQILKEVRDEFVEQNPDKFCGARFILAGIRGRLSETELAGYFDLVRTLMDTIPGLFSGFDLNGQEDRGQWLIQYAEQVQ